MHTIHHATISRQNDGETQVRFFHQTGVIRDNPTCWDVTVRKPERLIQLADRIQPHLNTRQILSEPNQPIHIPCQETVFRRSEMVLLSHSLIVVVVGASTTLFAGATTKDRKFARLTIEDRDGGADQLRTHAQIKSRCVRVRLNLKGLKTHRSGPFLRVAKERPPDAASHLMWQHPKMFQPKTGIIAHQGSKADDTSVILCNEGFVRGDKLRGDGENGTPVLDPRLRLSPVALRSESDLRKLIGLRRMCDGNLHEMR